MWQPIPASDKALLDDDLGSTVTATLSLDVEINRRIGKAATTFGKLFKRAWNNKHLTIKTKILIYQACVLTSLLYGSETWTTYSKQEKKLNTFHLRCLRKILNIKWQDQVTNTEILKEAQILSVQTIADKKTSLARPCEKDERSPPSKASAVWWTVGGT